MEGECRKCAEACGWQTPFFFHGEVYNGSERSVNQI